MKILPQPPKTGKPFIVASFDDGQPFSGHYRYDAECNMFIHSHPVVGDTSVSDGVMTKICKHAMIIVE